MRGRHGSAVCCLAVFAWLAAPGRACADSYQKLAKELSRFSGRLQSRRVAVLPFAAAGGENSEIGLALSERLMIRLVEEAKVEVVERTLLKRVLDEQGLGYQGILDPRQSKQLGRVLGVDAVVTGTFLHLPNGDLEVNARLIDAEGARILGASSARVNNEWRESAFSDSGPVIVSPPSLEGFGQGAAAVEPFRDSVADGPGCSDWESRVYALQNSALELKARYWATKLRDPRFTPGALTRNPGSEIRSLQLRQELYARIRELYRDGYAGGVAAQDQGEIDSADRKAEHLQDRCDR